MYTRVNSQFLGRIFQNQIVKFLVKHTSSHSFFDPRTKILSSVYLLKTWARVGTGICTSARGSPVIEWCMSHTCHTEIDETILLVGIYTIV